MDSDTQGVGAVRLASGASERIAIRTEGLTKYYGRAAGIVNLDLEVRTGEVFGFLGPNGAGKSTTIRLLLDLLHPTRGRASVLGRDSRRESVEVRRRTGYLPADLALYRAMTGRELCTYLGSLRGADFGARAVELADRFDLDLDRRVGSFSTGMRQKLGIVQAFMHEPELLILDEPTSGLDPLMQQAFYTLIDEVREGGRTVFLSSHVLPEVERLADRVGIVRGGRLVAIEEVEALRAKGIKRIEIRFDAPADPELFDRLSCVRRVQASEGGRKLVLDVSGPVAEVIGVATGFEIADLESRSADLEEIFLAHYDDGGDGSEP